MKQILVFCHNYINYEWYETVENQLNILTKFGIYQNASKIFYGAYAEDKYQLYKFIDLVKKYDTYGKIQIVIHPFNDGEKQTLILLQDVCKNYNDSYVVYYHTKGVSSKNTLPHCKKNLESWKNLMEHFTLKKWQFAVDSLNNGYDVCGSLFTTVTHKNLSAKFYLGNFWWAKSNHINKLKDMKQRDHRWGCESWITDTENYTWASSMDWNKYASDNTNPYEIFFDPKEYEDL